VYHYSSAGAVLHTYDLGQWNPSHLLRIPGDSSAFWIHLISGGDVQTLDRIVKVRIADGAALQDFSIYDTQLPLEAQGGAMWVTALLTIPPPIPPPGPPPLPTPPPCCHVAGTGGGGPATGHEAGAPGTVPVPVWDPVLIPILAQTCAGNASYLTAVDVDPSETWGF
jgi:hypothetical protein